MRRFVWMLLVLAACNESGRVGPNGGGADLGAPTPRDGGATMSCLPDSPDQQGCSCTPPGMRACWPPSLDPATRHVGACKDGMQVCVGGGEFPGYGACMGAVGPMPENCKDGIDNNCDGRIDCMDPTCATDPACQAACADGQTRECYDGPSGTLNVGTCRAGTQTCKMAKWPTDCPGEVLPGAEDCTDAKDHNCNHLPGCLDLFACFMAPNCQQHCDTTKLDPGCVCAKGAGDTATCPEGMIGVTQTSIDILSEECCPCTASDCDNAGCCGETVCAGSPKCAGLVCKPLPASCMGQVNADCDDFPEDCDEPCCKCSNCP
jgi:hypothetical protein